jgi:hypothetical protein
VLLVAAAAAAAAGQGGEDEGEDEELDSEEDLSENMSEDESADDVSGDGDDTSGDKQAKKAAAAAGVHLGEGVLWVLAAELGTSTWQTVAATGSDLEQSSSVECGDGEMVGVCTAVSTAADQNTPCLLLLP